MTIKAKRLVGRVLGRSTAGVSDAAMFEAVAQQEQRSWPADKDAATGPGKPQSAGSSLIELLVSARSDTNPEMHLQVAAELNSSRGHSADLPAASQLPSAAAVLHQMLHQPRWFAAGPVKDQGDAAEAQPAGDAEAEAEGQAVAKDPRDEEIAQQAEQVGAASRVCEMSAAGRTVFLGQASRRPWQNFRYQGRACKPAGYPAETCTAAHMVSYLAAASHL